MQPFAVALACSAHTAERRSSGRLAPGRARTSAICKCVLVLMFPPTIWQLLTTPPGLALPTALPLLAEPLPGVHALLALKNNEANIFLFQNFNFICLVPLFLSLFCFQLLRQTNLRLRELVAMY